MNGRRCSSQPPRWCSTASRSSGTICSGDPGSGSTCPSSGSLPRSPGLGRLRGHLLAPPGGAPGRVRGRRGLSLDQQRGSADALPPVPARAHVQRQLGPHRGRHRVLRFLAGLMAEQGRKRVPSVPADHRGAAGAGSAALRVAQPRERAHARARARRHRPRAPGGPDRAHAGDPPGRPDLRAVRSRVHDLRRGVDDRGGAPAESRDREAPPSTTSRSPRARRSRTWRRWSSRCCPRGS
jgi:hypothetical protein